MYIVLALIVGLAVGFLIGRANKDKKASFGYLRIDNSDPDSPYLFIEFKDPSKFNQIYSSKQICLDVKREDFLPHK